jgi:hypothetical protein
MSIPSIFDAVQYGTESRQYHEAVEVPLTAARRRNIAGEIRLGARQRIPVIDVIVCPWPLIDS